MFMHILERYLTSKLCNILPSCRLVGEKAVAAWFPKKLESFKLKLEENKAELPFFLLFLRLFPMSPNWYEKEISNILLVNRCHQGIYFSLLREIFSQRNILSGKYSPRETFVFAKGNIFKGKYSPREIFLFP